MSDYNHTQPGYLPRIVFTAGLLFVAAMALFGGGFHPILYVVVPILVLALLLMQSLTVVVVEGQIEVIFGRGLLRREFPLRDVASCRIVQNPWYFGWGVRLTPHGWLYNVSGLDAVELQMRDGKRVRIGTDDPRGLYEAVSHSIPESPGS